MIFNPLKQKLLIGKQYQIVNNTEKAMASYFKDLNRIEDQKAIDIYDRFLKIKKTFDNTIDRLMGSDLKPIVDMEQQLRGLFPDVTFESDAKQFSKTCFLQGCRYFFNKYLNEFQKDEIEQRSKYEIRRRGRAGRVYKYATRRASGETLKKLIQRKANLNIEDIFNNSVKNFIQSVKTEVDVGIVIKKTHLNFILEETVSDLPYSFLVKAEDWFFRIKLFEKELEKILGLKK